jgi:hypothetical protein
MGEMRNSYKILIGNLTSLQDLGAVGEVLLKLILGKYDGRLWAGLIWLIYTSGGLF